MQFRSRGVYGAVWIAQTFDRPQHSPEDIKKLEAAQRNNKVSE
jgi:hypothetical protein